MPSNPEAVLDGLVGGPYHFRPGDIVVALEHLALVKRRLAEAEVTHGEPVESELLGLAKITLNEVAVAAQALEDQVRHDDRIEDFDFERRRESLDLVLACLRALVGADNGGWFPPMGKNRLVSRVRPARVIWYAGTGGGSTSDKAPHRVIWYGDPKPDRVIWYGDSDPDRVIWYADERPERLGHRRPGPRATTPGAGVRVGVLDSGIYAHPWLAGAWISPIAETVSGEEPTFLEGHGTFVTGLVLSQAPGATVVSRRVLLGSQGTSDTWKVAEAIVGIGRSGIDILNLSFGCYTDDGQPPLVLATAIDRLDPRIVVVAAAGNHAQVPPGEEEDEDAQKFASLPSWPAALDDVIAVGAADREGVRAPFSPNKDWVNVHACGVQVCSTYLPRAKEPQQPEPAVGSGPEDFDGWAEWSGTSFASPLVAGAIAAVMDEQGLTAQQAATAVLESARTQHPDDPERPGYLRLDLW